MPNIIIIQDLYFEDYINDPEIMEMYCDNCLNDSKCLKKIRKDFDKHVRSFFKLIYPDQKIEGIEDFDGEKVKCWYKYDNKMEILN